MLGAKKLYVEIIGSPKTLSSSSRRGVCGLSLAGPTEVSVAKAKNEVYKMMEAVFP